MSGGSMDYFYCNLKDYAYDLKDRELVDLALDLAELFHDREWYDSGDYCEGDWNESVLKFKEKWFETSRKDQMAKYINNACNDLRNELMKEFGCSNYCKDCKNFNPADNKESKYGDCNYHQHVMVHQYKGTDCDKFEANY